MDLCKAFDCLPHQLIIAELKAYGLSTEGCGLQSNRKQTVILLGVTSEWMDLVKGVPQGSVCKFPGNADTAR